MSPATDVWRPDERPGFAGPALVDTHVWIWYLDGAGQRMADGAVDLLRRSVRGEGLVVSDISVWEIGMKVAKGSLRLTPDVDGWIGRAARRPGFSFLPLDREILLGSTRLPGEVHGDPADRMLMTSAALSGMPLVTADGLIARYARDEGGLTVCDVSA